MPANFDNEHSGFTLLEVMVAVAILATALVGLFGLQSRTVSYAAEARFNTLAPMLANGKFAELESEKSLQSGDDGDFGTQYPGFNWELEIEPAQLDELEQLSALDPPLVKAKLTVTWSQSNYTYSIVQYGRWGD